MKHSKNPARAGSNAARVPHALLPKAQAAMAAPRRVEGGEAIAALLQAVQRAQTPITLFADTGGSQQLPMGDAKPCGMGLLAQVDAQQHMLAFDISVAHPPPEAAMQLVVRMDGGEHLQWQLQGEWQPLRPGHWSLLAPWPAHILQHQRRRYPRVQLPVGQNLEASFMFGRRRCALQLEDISAGGVGLRGAPQDTDMLFMGRQIADAVLDLGDVQVQVDLTVRSRRKYQSFLLGTQVMVGCSLEGDAPALQAALAQVVAQREGQAE